MGQCMESMGAAQAAAYTIYEIIDRVPSIDSESNAGMSFENGDIRFSSVDFTFPAREEQQVLKGVSFEVNQGQTVALCGQSGCGKSTCIKLLQRFYDVCSGSITIAGTNIKVSTWMHLDVIDRSFSSHQHFLINRLIKDIAEDQTPLSPSRSDSLQFLSLPQMERFDWSCRIVRGLESLISHSGP